MRFKLPRLLPLVVLLALSLLAQSSSASNCASGCLSCSPLDHCLLCDSQRLLYLKTTFSPSLPFPHLKTECLPTAQLNCAKIDSKDNCLHCKEGFFPREGVCVEAEVKIGGCLEQIDNGLCRRCKNNFTLDSKGECLAIDVAADYGEGCQTVRGDKSKCVECKSGFVMDDLGKCLKVSDLAGLVGLKASTLMVPQLTQFGQCQVASRFECRGCANAAFESDSAHLANSNYLLNVLGVRKYLIFGDQAQLDLESVLETQSPYIDLDNGAFSMTSQTRTCHSKPISNCLLQDAEHCIICENGYSMTSFDACVKAPNAPIPNCEDQFTELKCLKCRNGFFNTHENLSFCQESSPVSNCETYESKRDGCSKCVSGFTIANKTCVPRSISAVADCREMTNKGEGCSECNEDYVLATDRLGCFQKIENCEAHQLGYNGRQGRAGLACLVCKGGFYLDSASGHTGAAATATEGVVSVDNSVASFNTCLALPEAADANCEIFSKESLVAGNSHSSPLSAPACQKCKQGYYLSVSGDINSCKKYPANIFSECSNLSGFTDRKCLQCSYQNLLLKTKNLCLPPKQFLECLAYKSPTQCAQCKEGYFSETCLLIPESMNCLRIENEGQGLTLATVTSARCGKCKENFHPNQLGGCREPNDFESKFCSTFFNSGDGFICNHCDPLALPVGFEDKSICISKESPDFVAANVVQADFANIKGFCKRIKFNPTTRKYSCLECAPDRILDDKTGACLLPIEVQDVLSDKHGFVGTYYSILSTNSLRRYKQFNRRFWIDPFDNSVLDDFDGRTANHYLDPVTFTVRDKTGSSSEILYHSFYQSSLKGCKIFVPMLHTDSPTFGCALCKPGYYTLNDIQSLHIPLKFKATLFNLVDKFSQSDGEVPASAKHAPNASPVNRYPTVTCIEAASQEFTTYPYSMENCERYVIKADQTAVACAKCIEGYHGTTELLETLGTGDKVYMVKHCVKMTSCGLTATNGMTYRTDYNPGVMGLPFEAFATCGKCQSSAHTLMLRLMKNGLYDALQLGGDSLLGMECIDPTDAAKTGVATLTHIVADCGMYVFVENEPQDAEKVYCGSCKHGFKATSFWAYTDSTNNAKSFDDGNLGRVATCTEITNCQGLDWLNACSKCADGYIYEYDTTLKVVKFDSCVEKDPNIGHCHAAQGDRCYLCEEGFALNDTGVCDTFGVPLCSFFNTNNFLGVGNLAEDSSKINNFLLADWTLLEYFMFTGEGCVDCYDGYLALEVPVWGYWEKHFYCVFSNILKEIEESGGQVTAPGLDYNCLNYGYDFENNVSICKVCKRNFVLGADGSCDAFRDQLEGCVLNLTLSSDVCLKCDSGFTLIGSSCVQNNIENCEIYAVSASNTLLCSKCKPSYYLDTSQNRCLTGAVRGCDYYKDNNRFECISCSEGMVILENDISEIYEHRKRWDALGRVWKMAQPFWDFWVHLLFSESQTLAVNKRNACVKIPGIKCTRGRVLRVENVDTDYELYGSTNARVIDGLNGQFIQRALSSAGAPLLLNQEVVFECLECESGRWSTDTERTDIATQYALDVPTVWEKGDSDSVLTEIESILVQIDGEGYSRACGQIRKHKECLVQDSGAVGNLGSAVVDFAGALNIFGRDFLIRLQNGTPLDKLLNEYATLDLNYDIQDSPGYQIDLTQLSWLEDWIRNSSMNVFADFGLFLSFSDTLKKFTATSAPTSLMNSVNVLYKEAHDIHQGSDTSRALARSNALAFFRSSVTRSLWKCLHCDEGMYSSNGECLLRRNAVENCSILEPNSDGKCLQCNTGFILSETKTCTFLSKSDLENCIEYEQDVCQKCRFGYLLSSSKTCEKIPEGSITENCLRQDDQGRCLQCRFGHRFTWKRKCEPVSDNGLCWDYSMDEFDGCLSCQPFTHLFKGSDTSTFCQSIPYDMFTGASGFDQEIADFISDYVVDGFVEQEYKRRTKKGDSLSGQYGLTSIQADDFQVFKSDRAHCNLFDAFTPFNCISCHSGYALNVQTKKCELVASPIDHCEEYVSASKKVCVRCKQGYVLDYGINTDLFNTPTVLKEAPVCVQASTLNTLGSVDPNCSNLVVHNEYRCLTCLNGYFLDLHSGECKACSKANCQICSHKGDNRCLVCKSGFFNDKDGNCNSG